MALHRTVGVATLLFFVGLGQAFADFIPLRDLPGGIFYSDARGVSADGMVVVGQSNSAFGFETFRWTAAGGMIGLGFLPGGHGSIASGTSANGSVVVGISSSSLAQVAEAFRWTAAGGMIGLGFLPGGTDSFTNGVSADGRVVVGMANDATFFQAIRWTQESGMVSLGLNLSAAFATSADGSVVVGGTTGLVHAFRWTEEGVTDLGTVLGGAGNSIAIGVSADGSVIVGSSSSLGVMSVPFRWTEATGMVSLGLLPGDIGGAAFGVSADGSVIVGTSVSSFEQRAFVWNNIDGIRDLREVLISQGDDLSGWTLIEARGVSADGRVIIGRGTNPAGQNEAWLARLAGPTFAGAPGTPNCHSQSVSALVRQFGGLPAAASALGFGSVQALHDAIRSFCKG
jgi:probable HAF family extracellular repeat protein